MARSKQSPRLSFDQWNRKPSIEELEARVVPTGFGDIIGFGESATMIHEFGDEPVENEPSPNSHFLASTGDENYFTWQDQNPETPDVVDLYYDFRSLGVHTNSITAGQEAAAELALAGWVAASDGHISFTRNTTASAEDIINIGVGDLSALGFTSAPGGILALGGGTVTHTEQHTITEGIAWLDFRENWDVTFGNEDPPGTFDAYTVFAHEIGHALGLGHTDDLPGTNIMDGTYDGEKTTFSTNDQTLVQVLYGNAVDIVPGSIPVGGNGPGTGDGDQVLSPDQVANDDVIVNGSIAIGFDAVNGEVFGFDTVRLKENNLRVHFDDTSGSASFPSNDWRIVINDSTNGGSEYFAIQDSTGGRTPFRIEAGAGNNALYVEADGDVGFGTSNPVVELHVADGDTPTLRLEQNASSGWTPQTFDIAGNETNFFIRDVTNGSTLPFRIRPGAPTSTIDIAGDGDIGLGTSSPNAALHLLRSDGTAQFLIEETSSTAQLRRDLLTLRNNGGIGVDFNNTDLEQTWTTETLADGTFKISLNGSGGPFFTISSAGRVQFGLEGGADPYFDLMPDGNLEIQGTLTTGSSRTIKENFEELNARLVLSQLAALPVLEWNYNTEDDTVRHVGPIAEDFYQMFGLGTDAQRLAPADLAGVSLLGIQGLLDIIDTQSEQISYLLSLGGNASTSTNQVGNNPDEILAWLSEYYSGQTFGTAGGSSGQSSTNTSSTLSPTQVLAADQVINDDFIVRGSLGVGLDASNGQNFGFDTIRLSENNLRWTFIDTSSSASFPDRDWQIRINDSSNGGGNFFAIDDLGDNASSGSSVVGTPFRIEAGAGNHSLYVEADGDVGFGTNNPVTLLHAADGDTPTLRLEQNGTSGWTPQVWDLASNETNFFIRDATNGSLLPFRIRPGAPTSTIDIASNGDIGLGTASPNAALHLLRSDGTAGLLIQESLGTTELRRDLLTLRNNGGVGMQYNDTNTGLTWVTESLDSNDFRINLNGSGSQEFLIEEDGRVRFGLASGVADFDLLTNGNLTITGSLTQGSSRTLKENFELLNTQQVLSKLADLSIVEWNYINDVDTNRHLGPLAEDFYAAFGLGPDAQHVAPGDLAGVSLIGLQGLVERIEQQQSQLAELASYYGLDVGGLGSSTGHQVGASTTAPTGLSLEDVTAWVNDLFTNPSATNSTQSIQTNTSGPTLAADQVFNDDLIVDGSLAVGFDAVVNQGFGFDTLRLQENNLRVHFNDTSNSASFPDNDWRIVLNDSSNGGGNYFAVEDSTGNRIPFRIEAGARNDALYVDSAGNVGFGTNNPVVELHAVEGDTPTLRLEQTSASGWTPQTWDLASNETNFFIRDVTNGSRLPFRIRTGAPTSTIDIAGNGNIGLGTSSPDASLHLVRNDGTSKVLVEEASGTTADRTLLELRNNGGVGIQYENTNLDQTWVTEALSDNSYRISLNGSGSQELLIEEDGRVRFGFAGGVADLDLRSNGNLTLAGTLTEGSSYTLKENFEWLDTSQVLSQLANLPAYEWSYITDGEGIRHIGPIAEDFYAAFGLGDNPERLAPRDLSGLVVLGIQELLEVAQQQDQLLASLSAAAGVEYVSSFSTLDIEAQQELDLPSDNWLSKTEETDNGVSETNVAGYRASTVIGGLTIQKTEVPGVTFDGAVFLPDTIGPGSVTTLEYTITNHEEVPVGNVAFTNVLPAGVTIAGVPNLTIEGLREGTFTAPAGGNTITLSNGIIAANTTTTLTVDVTSSAVGTHMNVTGALTSDTGNSGTAADDLMVVNTLPGFSMSFADSTVTVGQRTTITYTIDNTLNTSAVLNLDFTDVLPIGLEVAGPNNASTMNIGTSITSPTVTAVPGSNVITLDADGTTAFPAIAAGTSGTVSVDVIATEVGTITNVSGDLLAGFVSAGRASASLEVTRDDLITVMTTFLDDPVAPGQQVQAEITIENFDRNNSASDIEFSLDLTSTAGPGALTLTAVGLPQNDVVGTGSTLSANGSLLLEDGILGPEGSTTFTVTFDVPTSVLPGEYSFDTSSIQATIDGQSLMGTSLTDTLFVTAAPVLEMQFLDNPVATGGTTTLEFTVTNTGQTEATNISFLNELTTFLPFPVDVTLPPVPNPPLGAGSTLTLVPVDIDRQGLQLTGGTLAAGASGTFTVEIDIPTDFVAGTYVNTTDEITATVNGMPEIGRSASASLEVVAAPDLRIEFTDDPVLPDGTATLEFTLDNANEGGVSDATDIAFTLDLDAIISGLTAVGLPQNDVVGVGSSISGTSVLTFTGGTLEPDATGTFSVTVQVPASATPGTFSFTTSDVTAMVGGVAVTGEPATDDLDVVVLTLEHTFTDPVVPGEVATLQYTLTNQSTTEDAQLSFFTHNLSSIIAGLEGVAPLPNEPVGPGSSIFGTTSLTVIGGTISAGQSVSFDVLVEVPTNAPFGTFSSITSSPIFFIDGNNFNAPASESTLEVVEAITFTKSFVEGEVAAGSTATLEYTITNNSTKSALTDITFTDDLDAVISGLSAVGLPEADVLGVGSTISGTSTPTLTGGSLGIGQTGTFSVTVQVPTNAASGSFESTTSAITGNLDDLPNQGGTLAVTGTAAMGTLVISDLDFGDAPDSYGTLLASDGARHVPTGATLGRERDSEADAPAGLLDGTGDDVTDTPDDEEGVVFTTALTPGEMATVAVTVSEATLLNAFVDFNNNGSFADAGEQIFTDEPLNLTGETPNMLQFQVPSTAVGGATTYARFRVSSAGGLSYDGPANDGEVEDYQVTIATLPPPVVTDIDDGVANNNSQPNQTLTYTVTFDQDIDHTTVDALDFDNDGTAAITIGTITETTAGVFEVEVTPTTEGTLRLRIPGTATINGASGNTFVPPVLDNDTLTIDGTAPAVLLIDDGDADDRVQTNQTLTYTITFDEDIDDTTVDAADFDNAGTATITIGTINETSDGVFEVQVTPTTEGTLRLRIPAGATISDLAGNALVLPVLDNDTLTVDGTPPTVVTIDDGDADNLVQVNQTLTYTITFSEDIDAATVDAADFDNDGTSTITIGTITETTAGVFEVEVTPTTEGTLRLRIPATATISDLVGNAVAPPVLDDDTLTVDGTPPTVVTIDDGDADNLVQVNQTLTYTITFSEDIDAATVDAADFDNDGTAAITIGTITETTAGVFEVEVTPTSGGTLRLRIPATATIRDLASNAVAPPVLDDDTLTVDGTPPTVVTIDDGDADNLVRVNQTLTYTITFSEDIDAATVDAADFDNAGTSTITVGAITETSAGVFSVQITPTTGGTLQLRIVNGATIDDTGGIALVTPVTDADTLTVDGTSPSVVIEADDVPGAAMNVRTFTVTFSEPVLGFQTGDVLVGGTSGANSAVVNGGGAVYTVTVTGMTQTGSITLSIPDGVATDTVGNLNTGADLTVGTGGFLVTAEGAGGSSRVIVRDEISGTVKFDFLAFAGVDENGQPTAFGGGVRVATGDINGDGTPDIIVAASPGGGPHVKIFDGSSVGLEPTLINEFFAYVDGFAGGVFVASADVNGDGFDDVITGAGAGGTAHVRIFGGNGAGTLGEFFAYGDFAGGVTVAAADVDGDGRADIITGAGPGGSPLVRVINALSINDRDDDTGVIRDRALLASFFAYDPAFDGGVFVAAKDVNGDGRADILTGAGPGGGPDVKLIDGTKLGDNQPTGLINSTALLAQFFAYPEISVGTPSGSFTDGVRVAFTDTNADGIPEILTSPATGGTQPQRVVDSQTLAEVDSFFAFPGFAGDVFIA